MISMILIDNDKMSLQSMYNFFSTEFNVAAFTSPLAALQKSKIARFDIILSDYRLPYMNGIELINKIKSMQPGIKTILIAGYYTDKILKDARNSGINHFFPKPIRIKEIINSIYKSEINQMINYKQ